MKTNSRGVSVMKTNLMGISVMKTNSRGISVMKLSHRPFIFYMRQREGGARGK